MRATCIVALMVCIAWSAKAAEPASGSPFGVVCPWGGIESIGIGSVRGGAGATALGNWCSIEKEKGVLTWEQSDSELEGVLRQGLAPLPILGYTPAWASSGPNKEASAPPSDLLEYGRFVARIASRYKGRVESWEVWNEPDIDFWTGTISQYADLLKTAYTAAKLSDPECEIVFGGTAGVNIPFIRAVYELGGRDYFDVMAVHPYQWGGKFNDDWFVSQLTDLRALMNSNGDSHKEIWLTELGWSTGDSGITEDVQARLLTQAMATALTLRNIGVTKTFWFCVKDWGGPGYGLLRPDGSKKPAYTAYSVLTRALSKASYQGRLELGDAVRCHVFTRGSSETVVAVVWADAETRVRVPACTNALVIDYMGRRVVGSGSVGGALELEATQEPIFIIGADKAILTALTYPDPLPYTPRAKQVVRQPKLWAAVLPQDGTSRPYVVAGRQSAISVRLQHQGSGSIRGKLHLELEGAPKTKPMEYALSDDDSSIVTFQVDVPSSTKPGFAKCTLRGDHILPANALIRVAEGRTIEFAANSTIEGHYLISNEGSGGAPSVRFNGTWTYRFDLGESSQASVDLNVGAHAAGEWRVLASGDAREWTTILSGRSDRSWHKVNLKEFVGKPVYLKFEGNDQQLEELILTY